jgi:hypothetical protein
MVRDPVTGVYRRTRLFVMTLGNSRKAVDARLLASRIIGPIARRVQLDAPSP